MATRTTWIEESILRSACSYLYGHSLALEVPGERNRAGRARTSVRRRLPRLLAALARARGGRAPVAHAGGCPPSRARGERTSRTDGRRPFGWGPAGVGAHGSDESAR